MFLAYSAVSLLRERDGETADLSSVHRHLQKEFSVTWALQDLDRTKPNWFSVALPLLLLVNVTGVGCQRHEIKTAPVSGTVTLNGQPLRDATIVFQPSRGSRPGPPSAGETDDEGHFELSFADETPGAVVGPHRVMISTRKMGPSPQNEDREIELFKEQVPDLYRQTPLEFEVPEAGAHNAIFALQGPPPGRK